MHSSSVNTLASEKISSSSIASVNPANGEILLIFEELKDTEIDR